MLYPLEKIIGRKRVFDQPGLRRFRQRASKIMQGILAKARDAYGLINQDLLLGFGDYHGDRI